MTEYRLEDYIPTIPDSSWVAPNAAVIGDVDVGDECSIWPHATIRADSDRIRIGDRVNVQDGAVIHTADGEPALIGDDVTIGHGAVVHACEVGDEVLIGMNATVLSGAEIGDQVMIGAGAVVPEGRHVPDHAVVMGVPGQVVRRVTDEDIDRIRENAQEYVDKVERYTDGFGESF